MSELKPVNLSNLERFLTNIKAKFVQIKNAVLTVNNEQPDDYGNVQIDKVGLADDLESSIYQTNSGEYIERTSGGEAPVQSGEARLISILGRAVHTGYVSDEDRGTITVSTPTAFVSTGWNLYQPSEAYSGYTGYARVINYSNDYGFRIAGTYTSLKFSSTLEGDKQNLTVSTGNIVFPTGWTDGYVWVVGGNSANTAVYMTWRDWTSGYQGDFAQYAESTIDLSSVMTTYFPYGLLQAGSTCDEISISDHRTISRVDRLAYSTSNLETAQNSGREWDADENYIYLAKAPADFVITNNISITGTYTVNDHGMEYFTGTDVAVYATSRYGASLKNKLETDVLTISQQELSSAQQSQVRQNINAPSSAELGWTFVQKQTGTTAVQVPTTAREYLVLARYGIQGSEQALSFLFNIPVSTPSGLALTDGYYTSSSNGMAQVTFTKATTFSVALLSMVVGGTDYKATSSIYVWYR